MSWGSGPFLEFPGGAEKKLLLKRRQPNNTRKKENPAVGGKGTAWVGIFLHWRKSRELVILNEVLLRENSVSLQAVLHNEVEVGWPQVSYSPLIVQGPMRWTGLYLGGKMTRRTAKYNFRGLSEGGKAGGTPGRPFHKTTWKPSSKRGHILSHWKPYWGKTSLHEGKRCRDL